MKLVVIPGHEKRSSGAVANKFLGVKNEYEFAMKVSEKMHKIAAEEGVELHVCVRDGVGISGAYAKARLVDPDAVIELHFNAFDQKASGTEVLFYDDCDRDPKAEEAFVKCLLGNLYDVYGRKGKSKRGGKELKFGERGWFSTSRMMSCPSVIVEPFFGDNEKEAKMASEKIDALAKSLVKSFKEYMKGDWKKSVASKVAEKVTGKKNKKGK